MLGSEVISAAQFNHWEAPDATSLTYPLHTPRFALRYFGRLLSDRWQSGFLPKPMEYLSVTDRHL